MYVCVYFDYKNVYLEFSEENKPSYWYLHVGTHFSNCGYRNSKLFYKHGLQVHETNTLFNHKKVFNSCSNM